MRLNRFTDTVYRLIPAGADPLAPAPSDEGRFHHHGQRALYYSLTEEGCAVAMRRYLKPGDAPREIAAIKVSAKRILDLRDPKGLAQERGINPSMVWQDIRAKGKRAPTWNLSDTARTALADGMLYASRSRPDLTHLVLFGVNHGREARAELTAIRAWVLPDGWA